MMADELFGIPPRPIGWVDRKMRPMDQSNVVHYFTEDGLEYWPDIQKEEIRTSDPSICLSFHSAFALDHTHNYLLLRFDGAQVVISGPNGTPFHHGFGDRNDAGIQNWRIDEILQQLELPDFETYPWSELAAPLPRVKIRGLAKFENRAQQNRFVALMETLISCVNGNWGGLASGERQKGQIIWGDSLAHSLDEGSLIR
jgi:hypothetical protein